ncbi:MAG: DNRLRE domain-containing protein [Candidatus Eisenbacteria bacterium]
MARTLDVDASEVAVIRPSAKSDTLRLLVKFAMPEDLSKYPADFACVSFGADCTSEAGTISFQAFALTRDWNAETVSWTGAWDKAGGDWDKSLSSYSVDEIGTGKTLEFDVTDFVNRWLKEPSKNFGIIVKVSGPYSGAFEVSKASAPKLKILY